MDTFQVKDVMTKMFKQRPSVQFNCIPCDFLAKTKIKSYPFAYCVNDEPSDKGGRHWVGIYIEHKSAPMEFFCSFGQRMDTYSQHFENFAIKNNLNVNQVNIDLQSIDSFVCGQHVLHYLYSRVKRISFSLFYYKHKGLSTKVNDENVKQFVARIMQN